MVRTFLKIYMELGSYFLSLQEQIKDIIITVSQVLVRRTASPVHADFAGLSSGAAPVVVRFDIVSFPPCAFPPTVAGCRLGGYPVGRDQWDGKRSAGGMFEDNDRCFSTLVLGAFSTGVFQHHCITPH